MAIGSGKTLICNLTGKTIEALLRNLSHRLQNTALWLAAQSIFKFGANLLGSGRPGARPTSKGSTEWYQKTSRRGVPSLPVVYYRSGTMNSHQKYFSLTK
jgi:hypothetical protein